MTEAAGGKPRRNYGFYLIAGAILLLALQGIIFLLVIEDTIGGVRMRFGRGQRQAPERWEQPFRVAVLKSAATARLWGHPDAYAMRVEAWSRLLDEANVEAILVDEDRLSGELGRASVLVLPGVACLGQREEQALESFLQSGGGIVASGPVATRDDQGAWRGWDRLERLFNVRLAEIVQPSGGDAFVTFRAGSFHDGALAPGARWALPVHELTIGMTPRPDAFWSDWRFRPARGTTVEDLALVTHLSRGTSRRVWFGFDEEAALRRPSVRSSVLAFLVSAVRWAGRRPLITMATWPRNQTAAAAVTLDVSGEGAAALCGALAASGIRPTLLVSRGSSLPRTCAPSSEVAVIADGHAPLVGQAASLQRERLGGVGEWLARKGLGRASGVMPPEGLVDDGTLNAAMDAGYQYTLMENFGESAVPIAYERTERQMLAFAPHILVRLSRTASDDREVIANEQLPVPASAALIDGFWWDYARIRDVGGLYLLHVHGELGTDAVLREAVAAVAARLAREPVWLATAGEIARWWRARSGLRTSATPVGARRIQVDVANAGHEDLGDVTVRLYLPRRPGRVSFRATVFHSSAPTHRLRDDGEVLEIDFARIPAQTNYTYVVALDE